MNYQLDGSAGRITLADITVGTGKVGGSLEFAGKNWTAELHTSNLDLPSLRKIAEMFALWPADYTGESGVVDLNISFAGGPDGLQAVQGKLLANTVGFFGSSVVQELPGQISFSVSPAHGWQTSVEGEIDSVAVFIDTGINVGSIRPGIAIEVTEQPLGFAFDMNLDRVQ